MAAIAATTGTHPRFERSLQVAILGDDADWRDRVRDVLVEDDIWSGASLNASEIVVLIDTAHRFDAASELRPLCEEHPDARVIVAAEDCCDAAARAALRAGAAGLVGLDQVDAALAPTVRAIAAGQVCVPRRSREQLQRQSLTTREKQTLALVVMGMTNGEIATRLFLAESTVKSHLSSAFQKLGVRSRNEATAVILDPSSGVGPGILTIPTQNGSNPTD